MPSRFLEEVPSQLIEDLGSRAAAPSWATPVYRNPHSRRPGSASEFADKHYNYEDESQETPHASATGRRFGAAAKSSPSKPFVASWMTAKAPMPSPESNKDGKSAETPDSIDNIARFFGGKPGTGKPGASFARPAMDLPAPTGAAGLKKGQRVRHGKYGEGTVLMREGDGENAKLTILFIRHGMKKLMEKFANLQRI